MQGRGRRRQRASKHAPVALPNGRVTGGYVLKQLVADGLLAISDAERFKTSGGRDRAGHPLANLAEMNYRTPNAERQAARSRAADALAGAARPALPYYHIDPLRVDFTRVVEVMSSSYATTYSILPVAVSGDEVTIATCEPFQTGWEREIEQITKKSVKRGRRQPARHRALHDRVLQACAAGQGRGQVRRGAAGVELRATGRARRQGRRPTTRTSFTSSTGCCSTRSISAPATSIWSRGASSAWRASASTACCTRCTRCRPA